MATDIDTVNHLNEVEGLLWPDDKVVCIKINIPERTGVSLEQDLGKIRWQLIWNFVLEYFKFQPVASVVGVHYTGKHHIRHIHWNIISKCGVELSNVSTYKSLYLTKMNAKSWFDSHYETQLINDGWKVSFKQNKVKDEFCKYNFFTYPLKEKEEIYNWSLSNNLDFLYAWDTGIMTPQLLTWFKEVGNEIYSHTLAARQREEMRVRRHENALFRLYDFCEDNRTKFNDLESLRLYLDAHYLPLFSLEDLPDPANFLTSVKKVAMKLNVWKYSLQK